MEVAIHVANDVTESMVEWLPKIPKGISKSEFGEILWRMPVCVVGTK